MGGGERTSRRPVSVHPCWARNPFKCLIRRCWGRRRRVWCMPEVTAKDLKDLGVTSCLPSQRGLQSYHRAGTLCERLEKHPRQSPHRPKTRLPSPAKSPHGLRRHPRGISLPELRGGDLAERRRLRRVMGANETTQRRPCATELKLVTAVNSPKSHAPADTRWQATGLLLKFD